MDHLRPIRGVSLVHDVTEKQDRLDDDKDYEMNGGQAGGHGGQLRALRRLLGWILGRTESSVSRFLICFSGCSACTGPNLSAALDQVFHVPLDHVQMLLDVVEMLNGFVRPQTAGVPLVLGGADLFHRLMEVVSAENKETDSCYKQLKVHIIPSSGASKPGPQGL